MLDFETHKDIHWYVDQMAIFSADNFFEKNNIQLDRFNIPIRTIINDYQEHGVDTFFKHSKGKGKTFTASPFPID